MEKDKNIFLMESGNLVHFNFKKFIENQNLINDKFPNPLRELKKYSFIFDSMAGQIMEELFELNTEIKKNDWVGEETDELLEEFCDVLMYIGSLYCETRKFISNNTDIKVCNGDTLKIFSFKYSPRIKSHHYEILDSSFIGGIRRNIYDRKYHKKASKKPDNYWDELLNEIIIQTFSQFDTSSIYTFLHNYLFFNRNEQVMKERIDKLNQILLSKEEFIRML